MVTQSLALFNRLKKRKRNFIVRKSNALENHKEIVSFINREEIVALEKR